jgi:hypothetical protein
VKNFNFAVVLFTGALLAQPPQLAPVPDVNVTIQTSTTGARQLVITNSGQKTITALVMASEVNRVLQNPANAPNAPHGGILRTTFAYDAAVSPMLKPIAPGTTPISMPVAKDRSPVVIAVVYADGSGVGDPAQLGRVALQRKAIAANLRAVITDTQSAISAKTADDFAAIMTTKVQSMLTPGANRQAIDATYGDLARINEAHTGMPFQSVQNQALPKALDNFKKRLATLQQLAPGI